MEKKETQPIDKDTRLSDIEGRVNEISRFLNEQAARRNSQLQFPIDFRNRRVINRDLPVIKSIDDTGYIYTVEINDREHEWDFTPSAGGGGGKSVTLIVGPAANADSADYDYTTDGTDDDVQIQAAIDALPATGGTVLLREGTYTIGYVASGSVVSSANGIHIRGMGRGTILKFENGIDDDDYIFYLDGDYVTVSDIYFDGNYANESYTDENAGALVFLGGDYSTVERCYFTDASSSAIQLNGTGVIQNNTFVNNSCAASNGNNAVVYVPTSVSAVVRNNRFIDTATGTFCAMVASTGETLIEGNFITVGDDYGGAMLSTDFSVINNYIITGSSFNGGVLIEGGYQCVGNVITSDDTDNNDPIIITGFFFVADNVISYGKGLTTGISGIAVSSCDIVRGNYIEGAGVAISLSASGVATSNQITTSATHGIVVAGDFCNVSLNRIISSSVLTNDTYNSIHLNSSINNCVINGNVITNAASNKPKYGISEGTSNDKNIITSNSVTGGVTGQINVVGGASVSANNVTT